MTKQELEEDRRLTKNRLTKERHKQRAKMRKLVAPDIESFRKGVIAWREGIGMTRVEAVKQIGISPELLAHIELGICVPSLEVYLRVKQVAGL